MLNLNSTPKREIYETSFHEILHKNNKVGSVTFFLKLSLLPLYHIKFYNILHRFNEPQSERQFNSMLWLRASGFDDVASIRKITIVVKGA
jgi:hypothetical protein